jgi:thiamine-phosphate pyrophosphorylase
MPGRRVRDEGRMGSIRRPIICLVTDRRRLGTPAAPAHPVLIDQITRAARSGVDLVQIRERDLAGRALYDLSCRVMEATAETGVRVLVNDRFDVALAAGAAGVHLRGDSFGAPEVRAQAPGGFLVGRSVHSADQAAAAAAGGGLDFLLAGPVFATRSKPPGARLLGLDGLAGIVASVSLPVLAIGGIRVDGVSRVAAAGAAGIAAIDLFATPGSAGASLENTVREVRKRFDSLRPVV